MDSFLEHTGPDLVIEVEITNADEGKIERYDAMGVRKLWRLRGRKGSRELRADFLSLRHEGPPQPLVASEVLDGLTPADVCDAVEPVRLGRTVTERLEAVARIVHRRQRDSVRVREQHGPPYPVRAPL